MMTYKEAVDTALKLIDSERSEFDDSLFPFFADTAQKKIAMYGKGIEKVITIEKPDDTETETEISDFYRLVRTEIRGSGGQVHYYMFNNKFITDSEGTIDVYYYAMPETIDENTPDDYEFEVSPETHNAIAYYIGYELIKTDDTALAQMLLNEWNRYMSVFANEPKAVAKRIKNVYPFGVISGFFGR